MATTRKWRFVHMARICRAVAVGILLSACGSTVAFVRLEPERATAVHVGHVVAVQLSSESQYAIGAAPLVGKLKRRTDPDTATSHFNRPVEHGDQTLVATPRDPGP